jgi:AcrR family transcriptional regulator
MDVSETLSRLAQRKAKRRQEILEAAAQLFSLHGYDGTTADAIAELVHLTKSALYTYVGSKEEIAVLLLEQVIEQLLHHARDIESQPIAAADKLHGLIVRHVEVVGHHPASSLLFLHSEHILSAAQYPRLYALRDQYEALIRQWIAEGQEVGVFDVTDVRIAGWLLLGSLNWVIRWFSPQGTLSAESIGHEYARILLRGLSSSGKEQQQEEA